VAHKIKTPIVRAVVILPTYNSGLRLVQTLREVHAEWNSVWVVSDGGTDGSDRQAESLGLEGVRVLRLESNSGKGAAVLHALRLAEVSGFTHALVMDADGQHPAAMIKPFVGVAEKHPAAFVCGVPIFGPDAPLERVRGRLVGNFFATVETLGLGVKDSLFGFRLYPLKPAIEIMESIKGARRFDFDTVLAVRLTWLGLPCINIPVPVTYPPRSEGGVSHFRYLRDNLLLTAAHVRLLLELPFRLKELFSLRRQLACEGLRMSQ
jgi:glycosyltransferase involved in cell wall biosynthesis